MNKPKINLLILLLCTLTFLFAGCVKQAIETTEEQYEEFEPIVEEWVNDYIDEISEDLGELIVFNIPLVKDIAGQLIKDKFVGNPESKIISVEKMLRQMKI